MENKALSKSVSPLAPHRYTGLLQRNIGSGHQLHHEQTGKKFLLTPFSGCTPTMLFFTPLHFVFRGSAQFRNLQITSFLSKGLLNKDLQELRSP